MTYHQNQIELILKMSSTAKNYDIDEIQKIKTDSSSLSHCFILTPILLIRTFMTLNIYSKPLIRPLISLLSMNQEF